MPWIAGGDNGWVDVVFYQTTEAGDPNTASLHWNAMFAQSLNANSREPVFTVSQLSDHIMHFGPICNNGLLCGSGTRVLLDFFKVGIGPDGLANVVYADTGNANTPSHISFARQTSGPLAKANPTFPTCLPGPPIPIVVSRKTHMSAGVFDINLPLPPSSIGIECRSGGASGNHTVVMTFPLPVTFSSATVCSGTGSVSSSSGSGTNTITVNLTGVANAQRINVCLLNATDGTNTGTVTVPMGVLLGDTTADGSVNSADISQTKSQSGHVVGSGNFREDVTIDGSLNSADISLVKSKSGTALP